MESISSKCRNKKGPYTFFLNVVELLIDCQRLYLNKKHQSVDCIHPLFNAIHIFLNHLKSTFGCWQSENMDLDIRVLAVEILFIWLCSLVKNLFFVSTICFVSSSQNFYPISTLSKNSCRTSAGCGMLSIGVGARLFVVMQRQQAAILAECGYRHLVGICNQHVQHLHSNWFKYSTYLSKYLVLGVQFNYHPIRYTSMDIL